MSKIELIAFDLDGVLVSTKELHFDALNKALKKFGYPTISRADHLGKYDGLPTREKLKILKVKTKHFEKVWSEKQVQTSKLVKKHVTRNEKLVELFRQLKKDGYEISVVTNSVTETTYQILDTLGIIHFDFVVNPESNFYPKPHPDMYLHTMREFNVGPKNTLILEDSPVGRKAATDSGAHLMPINSPEDVTYENILAKIKQIEEQPEENLWDAPNLNIVIPMAGAGRRFAEKGYTHPKPLIDVNGYPMIKHAVDSLGVKNAKYYYIVQKEHIEKYQLQHTLNLITPNCKIIPVEGITDGAARTCLLAEQYINNDNPLIICNSDHKISFDSIKFFYSMAYHKYDCGILTFPNNHVKWSYVKENEAGFITEVAEKKVVSNKATAGVYFWQYGSEFVKTANSMIKKNIRANNEFYVAPAVNETIQAGGKVKAFDVNEMIALGTPEDLEIYLKS